MVQKSQKPVSFTAPAEEVTEWDDLSNQQGLSRSEWLRQRVRAGARLWNSAGDFNNERFEQIFEESQGTTRSQDGIESTPVTELIKRNLSTTEPVSESELEALVSEMMYDALHDLQEEGEIKHIPGKGYKRRPTDD